MPRSLCVFFNSLYVTFNEYSLNLYKNSHHSWVRSFHATFGLPELPRGTFRKALKVLPHANKSLAPVRWGGRCRKNVIYEVHDSLNVAGTFPEDRIGIRGGLREGWDRWRKLHIVLSELSGSSSIPRAQDVISGPSIPYQRSNWSKLAQALIFLFCPQKVLRLLLWLYEMPLLLHFCTSILFANCTFSLTGDALAPPCMQRYHISGPAVELGRQFLQMPPKITRLPCTL